MGWTCLFDKPHNVKEYLNGLHTWDTPTHTFKVLDSAIVSFRTYFAAVERTEKSTGEVVVWASIVMMTFHKTGERFCYKEMSENMGPHYVNCPLRIINLLSDTDAKYAIEWREACRAHHAKKTTGKALQHGDIVTFKRPVKFTNGCSFTEMKVLKENRRTRFTPVDDPYSKYRIPKSALASYMA